MKTKTHRASAKRFRISGTGRIFHQHANRKHKLSKMRPQYRREAGRPVEVRGADRKRLRRILSI
ncbi:MAG TPA: 50S ribosomal protein L35 [Candidatus Bipolaricaulis anaerobius]|uniref:Large ribosomal subunit protein bL35 n=1 Tax=Candidatus Bipolaricaulis anaerobius TaxID=2026885 RepID=A0A2X3KKV7_9BACT|nr:50S ribosomal protein L35 [Candidatus Bipolaricaulis anaerobius]MBP7726068.1 50S ribosomal protein L35 [Candidatus Bipolaricaulis sp.]MDD2912677.1 50S ribosomal protein L35 [Candidatus Bipolaricaulis anaerobius]MDD3748245.1 50S ribosomal protein L35 [Candidatus Bipolaricaulis anaerobius]MDD5764032.1 50S ribosomal protein L35 [Candidatus Bipolaricaulis anaerobius]SQD93072.1 50S ribosomal protein L35 [Candidatus Bipolaricaulis anaerobius]